MHMRGGARKGAPLDCARKARKERTMWRSACAGS